MSPKVKQGPKGSVLNAVQQGAKANGLVDDSAAVAAVLGQPGMIGYLPYGLYYCATGLTLPSGTLEVHAGAHYRPGATTVVATGGTSLDAQRDLGCDVGAIKDSGALIAPVVAAGQAAWVHFRDGLYRLAEAVAFAPGTLEVSGVFKWHPPATPTPPPVGLRSGR